MLAARCRAGGRREPGALRRPWPRGEGCMYPSPSRPYTIAAPGGRPRIERPTTLATKPSDRSGADFPEGLVFGRKHRAQGNYGRGDSKNGCANRGGSPTSKASTRSPHWPHLCPSSDSDPLADHWNRVYGFGMLLMPRRPHQPRPSHPNPPKSCPLVSTPPLSMRTSPDVPPDPPSSVGRPAQPKPELNLFGNRGGGKFGRSVRWVRELVEERVPLSSRGFRRTLSGTSLRRVATKLSKQGFRHMFDRPSATR